jgi:hypothetical protein
MQQSAILNKSKEIDDERKQYFSYKAKQKDSYLEQCKHLREQKDLDISMKVKEKSTKSIAAALEAAKA